MMKAPILVLLPPTLGGDSQSDFYILTFIAY